MTLKPHSPWKEVWDILVVGVVLIAVFEAPLRIAVGYRSGWILFWGDWILTCILLVDIVFWFITPIKCKGRWVTAKKELSFRYLTSWFVSDFVSAIPFDQIFGLLFQFLAHPIGFTHWMRLNRLIKMGRMAHLMARWQQKHIINPGLLRLLFFLVWVMLISHYVACGWMMLGGIEAKGGDAYRYLMSLYWTVTTLTTVGYGDITPASPFQTIYTMVVMVLGVGVYAYVIGNIANLIANMDVSKAQYKKKMEDVNHFIKYRDIPHGLRERMAAFYEHWWERHRGVDESDIMRELPFSLKTDISIHLNRDIIQKVPIFKGADERCIRSIATRLKPVLATPGDYIIRKGDLGGSMYFISRGRVEVVADDYQTVFATLSDGQFFGEMALLTQQPRTANIRSVGYCDLYVFNKADFDLILDKYPGFAKSIHTIMEQRRNN